MVTFLHCVANLDFDDLKLLHQVLGTLENIAPRLESSEKLLKLCASLYRVAEVFLNSQAAEANSLPISFNTPPAPPQAQSPLAHTWAWLDSWITDPDAVLGVDCVNISQALDGMDFSAFE